MGSRNKVLLASLVSMVMVLSFAIGLVPGEIDTSITGASAAAPAVAITADGATPAGDSLTLAVGESISFSALGVGAAVDWSLASNGSAELVDNGGSVTVVARAPGEAGLYLSSADGADLVNLTIVDAAGDKALEKIRIIAPANGSRVFVQEGASNVPYAVSSLTNDPADTFSVRYTLNGDTLGQRTRPPYSVNIPDITDFITGAGATNTLVAAAASYAAYTANPADPEFGFSTTSNFSVIEGNFDEDGNALPDNPFTLDLGPGDSWVSSVAGSTRQVVIVPLVDNFAKVFDLDNDGATASIASPVNPEQVVTAFAPAGLIGEGELGYLILVVADTLEDLLDDLGDGAILNEPAETPVPGARYAEVSIIVTADGGATFSEIETPLAANVVVQVEGVTTIAGDLVRVFSYDSEVTEPPVFINAADSSIWSQVATQVGTGVVTASTNNLSVFAPYSTPTAVIINSVTNASGGSLDGTSQARATGGEDLVISVSNVAPADSPVLSIGGQAVTINNQTTTATGVDYEVTAPAAAALPALAASSTVPVRIEVNGDADESILTFVGPTVDSVSPNFGPAGGGTALTITGEAFTGATATVGGSALQGPTVTDGLISGTTPAGDPGAADVVVAYANNYAAIVEGGFAYTPEAPFIDVTPTSVFDDGGYTVRVNATMGTSFINPESGIDNAIYFTNATGEDGDGADPSQDIPAQQVTFVDDTRLDILTPDISALTKQSAAVSFYNVYWTSSAYANSFSKDNGLVSNFFENFAFVDASAAAYSIDEVSPSVGPATGGNSVILSGDFGGLEDEFQVGPPPPPTPEGRQSFFGTVFVEGEEIEFAPTSLPAEPGTQFELTLYHNRAPDATGASPASLTFAVTWDPAVLTVPNPNPLEGFNPVRRSSLLIDWYNKGVDVNFAQRPQGRLPIVLSGGTTFTPDFQTVSTSITTFDNQLPAIQDEAGTDQQNPFPVITITFEVVGAAGTSTPLTLAEYATADRDGNPLGSPADGLGTTVVIGGSKDGKQGADLFNVSFGTQAAVVEQAGFLPDDPDTDAIEAIAPAVEEAAAAAAFEQGNNFSVDVRVESTDFDPTADDGSETLFGIRKDGYAYQPAARQVTSLSPSNGWVFGAENVVIEGQGFTEETDAEDITVIFTVVDGDGASIDLVVEPSEVSDTTIVVRAPNLPVGGNFPNRTTPASVTVDFSGGDEEVVDEEDAGTFTYVKWDVTGTEATGQVTTNAFVFAADQGFDPGSEGLIFDGPAEQQKSWNEDISAIPSSTTGTLGIPPLPSAVKDSTDLVFGILRVTRDGELFGISNDPPDSDPFPGEEISGIFNFDLHLYQGEDLAEFYVEYDLDETAADDLPSIIYNVENTSLNRALIATGGVATWSRPTTFDFTFANRSLNIPPVPEDDDKRTLAPRPNTYSLEALLITEDTLLPDESEPVAAVRTRLVNLGAGSFALRSGQGAPRDLISALLGTTGGTQTVNPAGGDEVIITGRNIYWAVNLYAVPAGSAPAFTNPFGAPERSRDDATGRDRLVFTSPALAAGNYDLYLELPTQSKQTADDLIDVAGTLNVSARDFDFGRILAALATAILGGAVALIGILAGGDSSSSGGPCFIATAAYGTPMAAEIEVLRTFRDTFLLSNPLGAAFVDAYYSVSPALADVVAQNPVLASIIRLLLTPVLFVSKLFMAMPAVSFGLLTLSFALAMLRRRFSRVAS